MSCARYFQANNLSFEVADQNKTPALLARFAEEMPDVKITTGGKWRIDTEKVTEIIVSPGVPLLGEELVRAKAAGIPIRGDIDIFSRVAKAPIVGITGSNGKSTVTSMVGRMAEYAGKKVGVGGNLGVPALELLQEKTELYVLELSSFQLESTHNLGAHIATILNISADHMDRYISEDEYVQAKERIFRSCKFAVLNRDERHFEQWTAMSEKVASFGESMPEHDLQTGMCIENGVTYLMRGHKKLIAANEMQVMGKHNHINALASIAIAHLLDLPEDAVVRALREFEGLPFRCKQVRKIAEVEIYNDSKATNVGAANAAICGLGAMATGKIIVLLGGEGKSAEFDMLNDALRKYAKIAILFGRDAPVIDRAIRGVVETLFACDLESAFHLAMQRAEPADIVLLAPACASFDMFDNYMHRGETFDAIVNSYGIESEISNG